MEAPCLDPYDAKSAGRNTFVMNDTAAHCQRMIDGGMDRPTTDHSNVAVAKNKGRDALAAFMSNTTFCLRAP
jgi:hypothetical protein